MNYLSHIYLSGESRKRAFGNFIGDQVKGGSYKNLPTEISQGVLLHRAIDDFTDNHPSVREAVKWLKPHFGRYSAVVLDIYFDYLLASRFDKFSEVPLRKFSRRFYIIMILNRRHLPGRIRRFMWHFIGTNRLTKYGTKEGIREALTIMVRVHRMDISVDVAIDYLAANEEQLWEIFHPFFEELRSFSQEHILENEQNR